MQLSRGVDDLVRGAWATLVSEPSEPPPLTVTGPTGHLPSQFRVEDTAVACVGTALLAAAALHAGPAATTVSIDRGHVSAAVVSERHFASPGRAGALSFAPLSRFWPTADGWVRTHANYPWHKTALLRALGTADNPDAIASVAQTLTAEDIEARVVAAGGVAAAVRSIAQWQAHPQGRALLSQPLVSHQRVGDAPARAGIDFGAPGLPAEGVRVLDMTRVIAGPVCTRYLGALGADVLRIDPPGYPDVAPGAIADTLLDKRSAALDADRPSGLTTLHSLLDRADVVVCGYRPGSLDRFGLDADALAERHPGLVVVYLAAWGHTGPWAGRRGFDSVVQGPTGIAMGESADGATPGALPCQLLDHGTGYLAAAAALDALRRQRAEGGTHIRRLSLARTAGWLTATSASHDASSSAPAAVDDAHSWLVELKGPNGPVKAIAPPGQLADSPLRWRRPPTAYLADAPTWVD